MCGKSCIHPPSEVGQLCMRWVLDEVLGIEKVRISPVESGGGAWVVCGRMLGH